VPDQYLLETVECQGRQVVLAGGEGVTAPLYAAYAGRHLGVRFYLHGDSCRTRASRPPCPQLDELGKPLFEHRGIQPSTTSRRDRIGGMPSVQGDLASCPRRDESVGLHTSGRRRGTNRWCGSARRRTSTRTAEVQYSYPSRHFTTANPNRRLGHSPDAHSDYTFGAATLYETDNFGRTTAGHRAVDQDVAGTGNEPSIAWARCSRMRYVARQLGIKTCIGHGTL